MSTLFNLQLKLNFSNAVRNMHTEYTQQTVSVFLRNFLVLLKETKVPGIISFNMGNNLIWLSHLLSSERSVHAAAVM